MLFLPIDNQVWNDTQTVRNLSNINIKRHQQTVSKNRT